MAQSNNLIPSVKGVKLQDKQTFRYVLRKASFTHTSLKIYIYIFPHIYGNNICNTISRNHVVFGVPSESGKSLSGHLVDPFLIEEVSICRKHIFLKRKTPFHILSYSDNQPLYFQIT